MPPPLSSMHTAHQCIRRKAAHACTKQQIKSTKNNAITDGGVAGQTETDHLRAWWWTWRLTRWLRRWQTQTWWWKQKLTISGETGPDHLAYLAYLKGSFAIYNVLWWPSLFSSAHGTGLKELTLCILFDKIKTRIRFHSRDQLVFLSHPNECDWAWMTENWSLRRRPDWRQGRGSKSNWKQPQNNLLVKW